MGSKARGNAHVRVQRLVKILEGFQCSVCGSISKDAAGHHLIFYKDGGPADLQNMLTLCAPCHRSYHSGDLRVDIDRF